MGPNVHKVNHSEVHLLYTVEQEISATGNVRYFRVQAIRLQEIFADVRGVP